VEGDRELSPGERALSELLLRAHLAPPDALPGLIADAARGLGGRDVVVLLIDHAQGTLVPFGPGEPLDVEGTVAGRAYRHVEAQEVPAGDARRLWLPLVDGIERVGVMGATFDALDDRTRWRAARFAALAAEVVITKSLYGDARARTARLEPMQLAAEIQWSLMPPLTAGTDRVVLSAMLEPAYEVGGDLVDYALDSARAQFALFDAMGHGLSASVLSAVAVGAYRNARRRPADLPAIATTIEDALVAQFPTGRFVTAILAELDLASGLLRWINAGHPPPLLLREGRIVKTLEAPPDRPLGYGLNEVFTVREETLQPGDRLLAYTDGVVEARGPDGEQFGAQRLADFVVRAAAGGEPAPETMRRLAKAVLAHQHGRLQDDATHLLLEWGPEPAPDPLA